MTEGRYSISDIHLKGNLTQQDCLQIAHALEAHSRHPIALAFTKSGLHAEQITLFPNQGIEGRVNGCLYRIGSPDFCQQWLPLTETPDDRHQWLCLCTESGVQAWFALEDALRTDARALTDFLKDKQIKTAILSGDTSIAVDHIASALNITEFHKGMSSAEKLHQLRTWQASGLRCLMAGDGVNDAPVLAQSDVSVTLLHACDWVKNSTDIILLNNQIGGLKTLFIQAKRHHTIVWQNFTWALLYNGIAIPMAMAGFVTPYWAALGMSLSSIVVVINSRRLKKRL